MTTIRQSYRRNWTWLYVLSFLTVAVVSYNFEKEIEVSQLSLPVDYN